MTRRKVAGNPDDEIRDAVLRCLYAFHRKARSPQSAGVGIRELGAGLKPRGYKQQEIAHNLDYLIQKGWVRQVVEERTFTTRRGTTQQAQKVTYKVSDVGIDRLETASTYRSPPTVPQVNITNVRGVTVVGDGNVVNTTFTELARVLNEVRQAVLNAASVSDEQKLDAAAGIDTLQAQLQKPSPDKEIVKRVWGGIEKIVTAAGLAELLARAAALLAPLIT